MRSFTFILVLCVSASSLYSRAAKPEKEYLKADPQVVEAWKDMRFGMFLCWGPVTLTGKEIGWSRRTPTHGKKRGYRGAGQSQKQKTPIDVYDNLYKTWKPDRFDAEHWVRVARDAGQQYLIFLVKHHDGFCLYDTKLTGYRSTGPESAWKVDVLKHVADACHRHDLKLMVYYSQPDWHHPDYLGTHHDRYIEYLHGQVREILTNYGTIDGLWFDNLRGRGHNPDAARLWDAENLFKMARSIQPHLIINDRCGLDADYYTPEQHVGRFQTERPWESCITLGTQWAWKPDDHLKPATDAIRMLVACAVGDGNLALNTNPMPDGRIEPRQVESFRQIGQWMEKYGESIYDTRGGPFIAPDQVERKFGSTRNRFQLPAGRWWGGSTHKENTVYLHVLRWPSDTIFLPDVDRRVVSHSVLTGGQASLEETEGGLNVSVPTEHRDPLDTIIKIQFDRPLDSIKPITTMKHLLSYQGKATASGSWTNPRLGPELAFDGDLSTRWGGSPKSTSGWLAFDFGKPTTVSGAVIHEGEWDRVRKYELQYKAGDGWKTITSGSILGAVKELVFEPVTARHFRLNILEATNVPTIWEVQLFHGPNDEGSALK